MKQNDDILGVQYGTVRLREYTDEWSNYFESEKGRIIKVIGDKVLVVDHIGSTAIPGMLAKPIIDVLIGMETVDYVSSCIKSLEGIGYTYKGEYGLPGRHFFLRGDPIKYHLHIMKRDSDLWRNNIIFRDFLRNNQDAAQRYSEIKRELAERFKYDRDSYTSSKAPFIESILEIALGKS